MKLYFTEHDRTLQFNTYEEALAARDRWRSMVAHDKIDHRVKTILRPSGKFNVVVKLPREVAPDPRLGLPD